MILLDTHVLLWCSLQHGRLGSQARDQIRLAWRRDALAVSAISFWEVACLRQQGRVLLARSTEAWRRDWLEQGLREVSIDGALASAAAALEGLPQQLDLARRCIVVTALHTGATLVTADPPVLAWSGELSRLDARV